MKVYVVIVAYGLILPYRDDVDLEGKYKITEHGLPDVLIQPQEFGEGYLFCGVAIASQVGDPNEGHDEITTIPRGEEAKLWRLQAQDRTKQVMMELGIDIPPNEKFQWRVIKQIRDV